jgi:hypothetical protein
MIAIVVTSQKLTKESTEPQILNILRFPTIRDKFNFNILRFPPSHDKYARSTLSSEATVVTQWIGSGQLFLCCIGAEFSILEKPKRVF